MKYGNRKMKYEWGKLGKGRRCWVWLFLLSCPFLLTDSRAQADVKNRIRENYYRKKISDPAVPIADCFAAYDSLGNYLEKEGRYLDALDVAMAYGKRLSDVGNYISSIKQYEKAKFMLERIDTADGLLKEREKRCFYDLGKLTMNMGFYPQSVRYFFEVLNRDEKDNEYAIKVYSNLTLLFLNMKQEKQAKTYLMMAKRIFDSVPGLSRASKFAFHNNLAGWYYSSGRYDSAVIVLNEAERIVSDNSERSVCNYNLGNIYIALGEMHLARECLDKVMALTSDTSFFDYSQVVAVINLAFLYGYEGNYDKALAYYEKALSMARRIGSKKAEATAYVEMSAMYEGKGQYVQALSALKKGVSLRDSLFSSDQMENVNLLSQEYIQREKELQMDILKKQLEIEKLSNRHKTTVVSILWICLLLFALSFCVALYNWFRQRKVSMEKDLGIRVKDKEWNQDVEAKAKQLAATNLQMVQATEIISDCRNLVRKMRYQKVSENKESLDRMEELLNSFNLDSAWDEFELYFNQLHYSFFDRLLEACPDLTRMEQRTCALLVLNFSTKEIANIMHRSARTVEAAIYQIRKKMNVPSDTRTLNFLQQFLSQQ